MQNTLHEHVIGLEHKVQALSDKLTSQDLNGEERERIVRELSGAELALAYYRKAYRMEQELIQESAQ